MTAKGLLTISNIKIEGEPVTVLQYNSSTIHLLGTSHLNPHYVVIVKELINIVNPQVVGVELCRTRIGHRNILKKNSKTSTEFSFEKIPKDKMIPAVGEKLRLMYVYGSVLYEESKQFRLNLLQYKRMKTHKLQGATRAGEFSIGAEILAPFRNLIWHADHLESKYLSNSLTDYKILLLDRPVEETFSAMAEALTPNQKELIKYYKEYFEDEFLASESYTQTLMNRLWKTNPKLHVIFLKHRDEHMAKIIVKAITKDKINRLVCIVGKSHLKGLLTFLKAELAGYFQRCYLFLMVTSYPPKCTLYVMLWQPKLNFGYLPDDLFLQLFVALCNVYKMDEEIEELRRIFQLLNKKKDFPHDEESFITIDDAEIFRDVKNFNDFVRKHGNSGGWDDIDHSVFVNLRRKHNMQSVIYHLRLHFPDISEEEIIAHEKWYSEYLKLKTLQQRAFKFWNIKKKDRSRPQSTSTVTNNTSISTEIQRKRDNLKIQIQKWKQYKEELKQNEQKIEAIKAKQNAEKEKTKKIIQENKKRTVMEYRKEKVQIQKAIWMAKLAEENNKSKRKRKIANKMLPFFRRKDEEIIRKFQNRRNSNQQKLEERQLLLQKLVSKYRKTITVERDPNRLMNPTVEWRQKILKNEDEVENFNIFADPRDITNVPHLAVPSWRKNLL